jgi:DNA-binding transcriptional LysR family regulator
MISKLEFLIAVAQEKHFGRAAAACGVTQPTLSIGLKQLEAELGVTLVRRGHRFLGFTSEGERVLEGARRLLSDIRAMQADVEMLKQGMTGHLRIAAIPTALPMVAALTDSFHARHPDVRYTVLSRTSEEILELLANLEVDIGLTYVDNEPLGNVMAIPLYRERFCLLAAKNSAVDCRKTITWDEVANTPLCLLTRDTQTRRILDRQLNATQAATSIMLESDAIAVLLTHILTGQWAAVLPENLMALFRLTPQLRAIPIVEPDIINTIGLIVGPREPRPPLVSAMIAETTPFASGNYPWPSANDASGHSFETAWWDSLTSGLPLGGPAQAHFLQK